jgi:hypothetical protein
MKFYDHSLNHVNAAQATAVERARQSCLKEGTAYMVKFQAKPELDMYWWNGCRYDALGLAKSFISNNYHYVILITPDGKELTREQISNSQY